MGVSSLYMHILSASIICKAVTLYMLMSLRNQMCMHALACEQIINAVKN